jgi:hypothetical protein
VARGEGIHLEIRSCNSFVSLSSLRKFSNFCSSSISSQVATQFQRQTVYVVCGSFRTIVVRK